MHQVPDLIIAAIGAVDIEDMLVVADKASVLCVCPFDQVVWMAVLV
ncbi:MAG: hypothetical protein VZQ80_06925 [Lachnospiraceae bacterium]|nr:hypothetical protein [Lachnospiraceae bacterium]